ncbi:VanY-A/VanY-F/VanY-M family D-Ala-D-Ala carboxypeptidase [Oceanobacillus chungangensis]|uniref:D-Ala-D-Ala carboxypeptidase VanY n=1 Tax=Oceanobacillus chungangensis TaxID=1229152 RepID=A0A3D8PZF2_9BACI|nr:VanY-A/VanY-F/VanY-M family D-Ala-D-Ala carboxypeptidase [Oceanobacillus chungangensis]RDW21182.1 D-Ala-D-Ala carboxypeptidase VanY [Oceanobacillus chungangensis]
MKKWGFLILLLFLGLIFVNIESFFEPNIEVQKYDQYVNDLADDKSVNENIQTIEILMKQIYQGNLLLVNNEYPVHQESIKSDIINLNSKTELSNGYELPGNDIYLSEDVAREFSKMIAAAEKEGVHNFSITSGFRDFDMQSMLYKEMGSSYALPAGYSEHNLGIALDVGSTQMKMADAPEGKWIEDNAWKYGFILRYPKDKTNVTGIQYEPWHIRYVGLPHSAIMKGKNIVLEEYLDYLKEEKTISASINGGKYMITYYPSFGSRMINIPDNSYFEISGNNIDGVIVTVYE